MALKQPQALLEHDSATNLHNVVILCSPLFELLIRQLAVLVRVTMHEGSLHDLFDRLASRLFLFVLEMRVRLMMIMACTEDS